MTEPEERPRQWPNRIVGYEEVDPETLLANPKNWRIHPANQEAALVGVLDEVGWVQDIVVNQQTGFVVDGHLRVASALSRHEPLVPIKYIDISEDEESLVLATLDPLSAMAGRDQAQLDALIAGLDPDSLDPAIAAMLAELSPSAAGGSRETNPDDADLTPPEQTVISFGELWTCGDHRVVCGDSSDSGTLKRLFKKEKARLVMTSPPYNQNIDTYKPSGMMKEHPAWVHRMAGAYSDSMPEDEYQAKQIIAIDAWWEWTTPDASVFYNHKHRYRDLRLISPLAWLHKTRWAVRQEIIWDRTSSLTLNARMFMPSDERVYWLFKGTNKFIFNDTAEIKAWSTVWRIPARNEEQVSAPFANEIAERPIEACSEPGDWVYDPFAGSGTVLVSCERLNRRNLSVEINPAYVEVILRRWERVSGKVAVREDGKTMAELEPRALDDIEEDEETEEQEELVEA